MAIFRTHLLKKTSFGAGYKLKEHLGKNRNLRAQEFVMMFKCRTCWKLDCSGYAQLWNRIPGIVEFAIAKYALIGEKEGENN